MLFFRVLLGYAFCLTGLIILRVRHPIIAPLLDERRMEFNFIDVCADWWLLWQPWHFLFECSHVLLGCACCLTGLRNSESPTAKHCSIA